MSYSPWMRDRVGPRVWGTAESLKVSHVAPAVMCKGQEIGRALQSEKKSGLQALVLAVPSPSSE